MGHYYWEMLVTGDKVEAFKSIFGDHEYPGYGEALQRHYGKRDQRRD